MEYLIISLWYLVGCIGGGYLAYKIYSKITIWDIVFFLTIGGLGGIITILVGLTHAGKKSLSTLTSNNTQNENESTIKKHVERMSRLDLSIVGGTLSDDDASLIIENVLDALTEVGNGITDEELCKQRDYMFALRDLWFKKKFNYDKT